MHTLYFDYICPPLFLTPSSSTIFQLAFSFLFSYFNPSVLFPLPIYSGCWVSHWSIANLPGATPLKKTNSPSPRSHQLPLASSSSAWGWCSWWPPLSMSEWWQAWSYVGNHIYCEFVGEWPCPVQKMLLWSHLPDLCLLRSFPSLFHDGLWALEGGVSCSNW